jgi:hypothetical protein
LSCDRGIVGALALGVAIFALGVAAPAQADDDSEERGARGPVLALEIGVGGVAGSGSTVYGPGLGKAFVLGYRLGPTTFEWHFAQGYRMAPESGTLEGERSSGSLGLSTVGARYGRQRRSYVLSSFLGVTRTSMPLLSLVSDDYGETTVERQDLIGIGGVGGIGIGVPIKKGQVQVGIELRAAYVVWERPGHPYVSAIEPIDDSSATFTEATEDIDAIPWTVAFGLRALL